MIEWQEVIEEIPVCGARRGGRRSRTFCELPPDHMTGRATDMVIWEYDHTGRTPSGRWYSWPPQTPTTGARERGICSECGRDFQLTKNGRLRHHGGDIMTAGRREYRCPGAGLPPQTSGES